jgi:tetratricopeptide (TPR) repeat protein
LGLMDGKNHDGQDRMTREGEQEVNRPCETTDTVFEDRIEKLYADIKSMDYYGILGVDRNATMDDIRRAYHRRAREFHPDRYLHVESDVLKEKLNVIFSYVNEAYRGLTGRGSLSKNVSAPDEEKARDEYNKKLARMRFGEGKNAFDSGLYGDAATLFGQATYLDDSVAEYYYLYGRALLKNEKMKPAEEALKRAARLDPCNSKYITELGYVYLSLGFTARARNTFEKALKCDPADKMAREGIAKLTG